MVDMSIYILLASSADLNPSLSIETFEIQVHLNKSMDESSTNIWLHFWVS